MRLVRILAGLAFAALATCESASLPSGPSSGDLDGHWGWQYNGNPGGSYATLSLSTAGNSVSGTGQICSLGPSCSPGSVTVTGAHVPQFGPFSLTIKGAGGYVATYAGQFDGTDTLHGTWTAGSQSDSVVYERCTLGSLC